MLIPGKEENYVKMVTGPLFWWNSWVLSNYNPSWPITVGTKALILFRQLIISLFSTNVDD